MKRNARAWVFESTLMGLHSSRGRLTLDLMRQYRLGHVSKGFCGGNDGLGGLVVISSDFAQRVALFRVILVT